MTWSELRKRVESRARELMLDTGMAYRECVACVVRGIRQEARRG